MTAFDPAAASKEYADKPTEDLVRIAYLEDNYLPEAKALALRELKLRGLPEPREALIARVRAEDEVRREEVAMAPRIARERRDNFWDPVVNVFMVVVLWILAAGLPFSPAEEKTWTHPKIFIGVIMWVGFAIDAIRRALRGDRRRFYLILVGPLLLFIAASIVRIAL